ncbi:hypothetical protein TSMG0144 [Halocynthia phage JM-2012]|uniref:hypothetical protein n=1 Tax=Halocynthia phage JM-2012 TaxID=1173297 RepID=UPI00025C696C|nr:hypothetical protein TSMG0144 [Halocynthia phage JM-2012]AFI55427.1 hypothetical protein TSMG0144 [Halocynthia phage JM-2012]
MRVCLKNFEPINIDKHLVVTDDTGKVLNVTRLDDRLWLNLKLYGVKSKSVSVPLSNVIYYGRRWPKVPSYHIRRIRTKFNVTNDGIDLTDINSITHVSRFKAWSVSMDKLYVK